MASRAGSQLRCSGADKEAVMVVRAALDNDAPCKGSHKGTCHCTETQTAIHKDNLLQVFLVLLSALSIRRARSQRICSDHRATVGTQNVRESIVALNIIDLLIICWENLPTKHVFIRRRAQ